MQVHCTHCNKETTHNNIRETITQILNGINITINVEKLKCQECQASHMPAGSPDFQTLIYAEYRRRTGLEYKG